MSTGSDEFGTPFDQTKFPMTPSQPELGTCPTCGSDDKAMHWCGNQDHHKNAHPFVRFECFKCADAWHSKPLAPAKPESLSEKINALPDWARQHIHDIETKCDPAGDIRTITELRDTISALTRREAPAKPESALPIDQCVQTIVADCLSRRDVEWLENRTRARIQALLNFAIRREQEVARATKQRCCGLLCLWCLGEYPARRIGDGKWEHGAVSCGASPLHEAFAKEGM